MAYYHLPGFDKWCRVKAGLSNAKLGDALGVSEDTVHMWREHELVPDPEETLLPLQGALEGPWHPSIAEGYWQELVDIVAAGQPTDREPTPVKKRPSLSDKPVKAPKKTVVPKADPVLEATKNDLQRGMTELAQAVQAAEQLSGGWFSRSTEKYKKYLAQRDMKHRKAYLKHMLERSDALFEKLRGRRTELAAKLEQLGQAVATFDEMQQTNSERMEKKRDENVDLWRELKAAAPLIASARQAFEKGTSKSLAGLDDVLKRAEAHVGDWTAKHDAIEQEAGVAFHWLTPESKLGQRLKTAHWKDDQDPFEGLVICKDKMADNYKTAPSHGAERPVEIDLSAEIDLTVAGLEERQRLARSMSK